MTTKLAAITITKNEATHLAEWVEFHILQGFEKFYIYDNHSTDFPNVFLAPYIEAGIVEILPVPEDMHNKYAGYWMYQDLLPKIQESVKWLWAGSTDEFMFCPTGQRVSDFLNHFENGNIAALHIPWACANSSGAIKRSTGLVTERFDSFFHEKISHVKSIVRPNRIHRMIDPHSSAPKEGFICVDENFKPVYGPHVHTPSMLRIRLNHYVTMSAHEYRVKIAKGRSDVPGGETVARPSQWHEYHPAAQYQNEEIKVWVPRVKDALRARFSTRPELISWYL